MERQFPAAGDPDCRHRSHYECVSCRKLVCARCGVELAASSDDWKTVGYWCPECLAQSAESAKAAVEAGKLVEVTLIVKGAEGLETAETVTAIESTEPSSPPVVSPVKLVE